MKKLGQYFFNLLISVDQFANALFGGCPDECISARLWREYPNSVLRKFVDILFGKDHCKRVAEEGDSGKAVIKKQSKNVP